MGEYLDYHKASPVWLTDEAYQLLHLGCSTWRLQRERGSPLSQGRDLTVAFSQSNRLAVPMGKACSGAGSCTTICDFSEFCSLSFILSCGSSSNTYMLFHLEAFKTEDSPLNVVILTNHLVKILQKLMVLICKVRQLLHTIPPVSVVFWFCLDPM